MGKLNFTKQVDEFSEALDAARMKILNFDSSKPRPVRTKHGAMTIEKFCKTLHERLGLKAVNYPEIYNAFRDICDAEDLIEKYAKREGIYLESNKKLEIEIPPDMKNLTLNLNLSAKGKDDKFFLTHEDETISPVSGEIYLMINQIPPLEAAAIARKVIPEYMPRGTPGVTSIEVDGKERTIFNVYTPPAWTKVDKSKVPDKLPPLFDKLVRHLFPIGEEREYFFNWLYHSLFHRAYVFLILCGAPGTGKNRMKLVLRALHGHLNTIDGKKSTLVERFNSQLSEATLAWFDELHYDSKMENTMKELQNDSISIERKGVDATRTTKIYSSIVISNNKPRDNYISFDARKFVPLVVNESRLEKSMSPREIDQLTNKVEDSKSETYDPLFLAQIVKWVEKYGVSKKWPNLEYRGPMFWQLAHTSMTRWQKWVLNVLEDPGSQNHNFGWDGQKQAFQWSRFEKKAVKRNADRYLTFPDYSSVEVFFKNFRNIDGLEAFATEPVAGANVLCDFWFKPLFKTPSLVPPSVLEQRKQRNAKIKKEIYDL